MSEKKQLVDTLKQVLKANSVTYEQIAIDLGCSHATVKRWFAEENFSIDRLESICALLNMDLSELFRLMADKHNKPRLEALSLEQEHFIAKDRELLLIAVCCLNNWSIDNMLHMFNISEPRCIQLLIQLDRMKMIELLPNNKIKLLVEPNFKWRSGGPIQLFFQQQLKQEFLQTSFKQQDEHLIVLNGMLSVASNALFQRKLENLAKEFDELCRMDAELPWEERFGYTSLLAVRPWVYSAFADLMKQ